MGRGQGARDANREPGTRPGSQGREQGARDADREGVRDAAGKLSGPEMKHDCPKRWKLLMIRQG